MPRIDPLKLLTCLSVLLAPNGGIRSANEVKRLANLMAKFSKKLVSKCIYIQILKCTETELLGQFMAAGGWSLVHMWLADGITTKNWPLIQELLELLLCCPVDVERLKSNTAPKLVKSLSKDSSHEGVRLLATKLVEQWLKIARNDIRSGTGVAPNQAVPQPADSTAVAVHDEEESDSREEQQDSAEQVTQEEVMSETVVEEGILANAGTIEEDQSESLDEPSDENQDGNQADEDDVDKSADGSGKKAPLLFKITMKNGKQMLAKVESPTKKSHKEIDEADAEERMEEQNDDQDDVESIEQTDSSESLVKKDDENETEEKSESDKNKERRKSDEKERNRDKEKSSSKDKDRHKEKDKDKKSSSSSSSSSSHKSSSKSSSSSSKHHSSSSSKSSKSSSSKSSSSSSSSSKDKERHGSSSSSKHKSSSSSSSSSKVSSSSKSSSSSSDKHRDQKEKDKTSSSSKDKDGQPKVSSPSVSKLPKIPRKPRDGEEEKSDSINNKLSPMAKKASISIEVRNLDSRPKTVKTYNSQFRSHGLIEEAPPPPSRKGLKKPASTATPGTPPAIGSTASGTIPLKRSSPTLSTKEGPPEKKAREDPAERPGAIKLIPAKRQPSLVESDMFMDALSATLKKDPKKRKRRSSGSEGTTKTGASEKTTLSTAAPDKTTDRPGSPENNVPENSTPASPPTTPTPGQQPSTEESPASPTPASAAGSTSPAKVTVAPMSFYRDTLADTDEPSESAKKEEESEAKTDKTDDEQDEDVEMKPEIPDTPAEPDDESEEVIKKPKRLKSELNDDDEGDDKTSLIDAVDDDLSKKMAEVESGSVSALEIPIKKPPGPGCGPDGPPGVLVIHRRKGPKKQLKWRVQEELEEVRYFELDVTERCNVTKTFTDLRHMERADERQKHMLSRKVGGEDFMVERAAWLPLILVDNVPPHPDGVNSQERRLQRDRERNVLQALYFNRQMIPDTPAEPDVEVYSISEPAHIPLDDVTGNPDSVNDFTSMPWPEPKSTPPHESAAFNSPFFPGPANDFPPFSGSPGGNWDIPGANPSGPMPGMFPPGRMPPGMPPGPGPNMGGPPIGMPGGPPNMMRPMNMPPNMPPNMMPPNMPPNMFPPNNFARGPPPQMPPHMNDRDDDNFMNGPPPPPAWMNNNRGGYNNNRGNFGGRPGGRGGGNWNNNRDNNRDNDRDNDRGGPRGGNYRPPWLQNNRGNHNNNNHRGRKW